MKVSNSVDLCIADIHFEMSCRDSIFLEPFDPYYQAFYGKDREGAETIPIRVHPELPCRWDERKFQKIFDTGQAWSIYRSGAERFITINPPGFTVCPLSAALFDQDCKEVDVYCNEILLRKEDGRDTLPNPFSYPLDRLMMMYILAKRGGAMFHAAGVEIEGRGYIFPGRSGAGKSTLSMQFSSQKGPRVLNDERIVVKETGGMMMAFGTPWPGDAKIARNKGIPLSAIFFIGHGFSNAMRELGPKDAFGRLLPVISIPWYDPEVMEEIIGFSKELLSRVPAYELHFTPGSEVVDFLGEFAAKGRVKV